MRQITNIIICLVLSVGFILPLQAVVFRPELQSLLSKYKSGELANLGTAISAAKAKTDEEHALLAFISAMLKTSRNDTFTQLQQVADYYPNTYYANVALLQQAKLLLLERKASDAKVLLQKITSADILERYYWLAVCCDELNDPASAISNAENYLRLEPKGQYLDEAHFLIAASYQAQNKIQSAIATLGELPGINGHPENEQYYCYTLGSLYQKAGDPTNALQQLKKGFELDKNSQIAFQIEDKLFELKAGYGSQIDLGFLYPYTELKLPEIAANTPADTTATKPVDDPTPHKLNAKPQGSYYIQAGRFGAEQNAESLTCNIRQLKLLANYFEDRGNKSVPWVVVSGPYPSKSDADIVLKTLKDNHIDCFITQY
jgi:tetratricopeptide (TPR) repeat protein